MRSNSRLFVSTFGGLIGLMGIEHGLGEILQGPAPLPGHIFPSWPDARFFQILGGEPAFSILPDMLLAGIMACVFSMAYLMWSVFSACHRQTRVILLVLSALMFLAGGGIFPPIFGGAIALFSDRLHRPVSSWHRANPSKGGRVAILWPWMYGLACLSWLAMIPGVPILDVYLGIREEWIILLVLACMFAFFFLADVASKARDMRPPPSPQSSKVQP